MRNILLILLLLNASTCIHSQKPHLKNGEKFMVGMYALQPTVGTKGHHTGSVSEIEHEVLSAYQGEYPVEYEGINCSIAYRHWDRVRYPNQNYIGYVKNYMSGIYNLTKSESGIAGMQVLTPSLYSSFFLDPAPDSPNNDAGINRELDRELFINFVLQILEHEKSTVLKAVDNNSFKARNILLDNNARPLAGWYLDDEPLVRNHDVEVIQSMAEAVKMAEASFFKNDPLFENMNAFDLKKYYHQRYIAFDADDLHGYKKTSRPDDGKFYNLNGDSVKFSDGHIYSVLGKDVFDVLMPDFYHRNIRFWDKILSDIQLDYSGTNIETPQIMPVIRGQLKEWDDIDTQAEFYNQLITELLKKDINGIWIYAWRGTLPNTMDVVETWTHPKIQLGKIVQSIK